MFLRIVFSQFFIAKCFKKSLLFKIPFDITLNSGATVSPKKANIQIPEPNFTMIETLQSMINWRTILRALIIDYNESVSNV